MSSPKYTFEVEDIKELTQGTDLSGFCCNAEPGDDPLEVDDFIHNHAKDHLEKKLSKTYLFYHEGGLVGVISMSMGSILLKDLTEEELKELGELEFKQIPVLLLGQIGTDYQHRRRGVCREMCEFAIAAAARISEEIGCRYAALSTYQETAYIYERIGFKRKTHGKKRVVMAQRI